MKVSIQYNTTHTPAQAPHCSGTPYYWPRRLESIEAHILARHPLLTSRTPQSCPTSLLLMPVHLCASRKKRAVAPTCLPFSAVVWNGAQRQMARKWAVETAGPLRSRRWFTECTLPKELTLPGGAVIEEEITQAQTLSQNGI